MSDIGRREQEELEKAERESMHPSVQAYLAEIGKRGGSAKSNAKTAAVRENARKPRRRKAEAVESEAETVETEPSGPEQAGSPPIDKPRGMR